VLWGADLFLRRKSETDRAALIEAIKNGWVSLNGMYANELTGLCRPEELLQLFRFAGELGREVRRFCQFGHAERCPGFTGVYGLRRCLRPEFAIFPPRPNFFDRIGTFMVEWQDKPFWWLSPSGKEKVLVWVPWTGYAMSHVMKIGPEWVGKISGSPGLCEFPIRTFLIFAGQGTATMPNPILKSASS